ncbi:hypothetical protein FB446DRAFT_760967 [Lentinula raphanica]|nr:hypothetical protein FB446DRAFT_760967 [Lentinula raphanica]
MISQLTATALSLLRRTFSTVTVDALHTPHSLSKIWASLSTLFLFRTFSSFFSSALLEVICRWKLQPLPPAPQIASLSQGINQRTIRVANNRHLELEEVGGP